MNPKSSNPEEFIMSHLLTLPEEFSTMDAHSVFKELMPTPPKTQTTTTPTLSTSAGMNHSTIQKRKETSSFTIL